MINEMEEQYVQIEQRLAKVDIIPNMEEGTPNQLQRLMCKKDNNNRVKINCLQVSYKHHNKITCFRLHNYLQWLNINRNAWASIS